MTAKQENNYFNQGCNDYMNNSIDGAIVPFVTDGLMCYHGKIDEMNKLESSGLIINNYSGNAEIDFDGISVTIENYNNQKFGIGLNKLLYAIIAKFTRNNSNNRTNNLDKTVELNLREFIISTGHDINSINRTKEQNKNLEKQFVKKIKKELELLYSINISIINHNDYSESNMRILQFKKIKKGNIIATLTDPLAEYLISKPLTILHPGILLIDEKKPLAYRIGFKMMTHFYNSKNVANSRNNHLQIKTLLKAGNIEYQRILDKDYSHWKREIENRLEANLDYLIGVLITDWCYVGRSGSYIDQSCVIDIDDPYKYIELYIEFNIIEIGDLGNKNHPLLN